MKNKKLLTILLCIFPIIICLITGIIIYNNKDSKIKHGSIKSITAYNLPITEDYLVLHYSYDMSHVPVLDAPYWDYKVYTNGRVDYNNLDYDISFYLNKDELSNFEKLYKELCSSSVTIHDTKQFDQYESLSLYGRNDSVKVFEKENTKIDEILNVIQDARHNATDIPYNFAEAEDNEIVMMYETKMKNEDHEYEEYIIDASGTVEIHKVTNHSYELLLSTTISKEDLSQLEIIYNELFPIGIDADSYEYGDGPTEDILFLYGNYKSMKYTTDSRINDVYTIIRKACLLD